MEVGLVTEHSVFIQRLLCSLQSCRLARAGYRPAAAPAGAQAPCTMVCLSRSARLKVRCGSAIVPQSVWRRPEHLRLTTGSSRSLRSLGTSKSYAFGRPLTKRYISRS